MTSGGSVVASTLVGALAGGAIGFFLRPSAPGIGQLPFDTVLTAGSALRGVDQLLQPLAQQSFKYVVTGMILGAITGLIVGSFAQRPVTRRAARTKKTPRRTSASGAFCNNCGSAIPDGTSYCQRCGFRRGSVAPRAGA